MIHGLPEASSDLMVFHAGTTHSPDGSVITAGGRVLCVTALGQTYQEAHQNAYKAIESIHFDGMQYRTDIGYRALG